MRRPTSILGLLFVLAKLRFGALSPGVRCRMAIALLGVGALAAWRASSGGPPVTESADVDAQELGLVRIAEETHPSLAGLSPDDRSILTPGHNTNRAQVWDARTGSLRFVLDDHGSPISTAEYRADGAEILTGSWGRVHVWDARTGKQRLAFDAPALSNPEYSPDGRQILGVGGDELHVWASDTGKLLYTLPRGLARYFPDSKRIITVGEGPTRVWDAGTGALRFALDAEMDSIRFATASSNGSRILTVSWDKPARLWNADTGKLVATLSAQDTVAITGTFSPDGRTVLTGDKDNAARTWDARTGALALTLALEKRRRAIWTAKFSEDGRGIVTSSFKGAAVWDARTGALKWELAPPGAFFHGAAFNPRGDQIVTNDAHKKLHVWSVKTGKLLYTISDVEDRPDSFEYTRNSKQIVTTGEFRSVQVIEAANGAVTREFHPDR